MPFHDSLAQALATGHEQASGDERSPGEQINGLATGSNGSRWMWVPHNLYFLLLAETRLFGLAAFLLFVGASLAVAWKAAALSGAWGGASLGLLIGMCGVLGYMVIDYAMWLDPVLYMFALVAGLLSAAPSLARRALPRGMPGFARAAVAAMLLLTMGCASKSRAEPARHGGTETGAELAALVSVDCDKVLKTIPRELYGANVDWVYDAGGLWDSGKAAFRPEMVAAVEKLHPGSLLFPAGISADFYHWRDGVGPQSSRPVRSHGSDKDTSKNGFGTDEFLTLCRRTGATPALLVNVVTGTPSEAAEWVAYCKSRNGGAHDWIVGNEPYMKGYSAPQKQGHMRAGEFAGRFLDYANAMRKADPAIRLFAPAGQNFGRYGVVDEKDWDKIILERAGAQIDYLSVHNAYTPVVSGKASFEEVYQAMFAFPERIRANLKTLNEHIDTYAPTHAKRIKLAVTEWGPFFVPNGKERYLGHTKTLGSALYVADALQVFMRADRVEMADFFKLTDPAFQGLVAFDGVPKATYYALQMFTAHFGNLLLASAAQSPTYDSKPVGMVDETGSVPYLSSVASLAEDRSRLYVLSVNRHFSSPMRVKLDLRGFEAKASGTLWTLTAPSPDANNGEDLPNIPGIHWPKPALAPENSMFRAGKPDSVIIRKSELTGISEFVAPPLSVTSLELERR
ncbi:MAG: hypothetical protein M3Y07_14700 [Acidobacteriota bacterium]|nr:hypothetical protein [Acidobacteriota bacterium]